MHDLPEDRKYQESQADDDPEESLDVVSHVHGNSLLFISYIYLVNLSTILQIRYLFAGAKL